MKIVKISFLLLAFIISFIMTYSFYSCDLHILSLKDTCDDLF
jgi:hypothetical protein